MAMNDKTALEYTFPPNFPPAQKTVPSGPLGLTHEALTAADELADSICDMVDDLIGAEPTEPSTGISALSSAGRVNQLAHRASSVNENIRRAHREIARLRNTL